MKKYCLPAVVFAVCALALSCEKPVSEAERNAQVEREVQQRLAAEHQTSEQERLAQQAADLSEREQALADKQAAAANRKTVVAATPRPTQRPAATPREGSARIASGGNGTPRSYDTFYRKLEPYGAWRETSDYGYVWQPQQAQRSRDWRPYTDGRWAYTDAGWTWISDEPFGWATYHYGRWTRLRGTGWVWVPGEEWAPAWVSWRTGNQNVGWAPLPPEARFERGKGIHKWADSYYDIDADEYVFIPNEDIGAQNVRRAVIPAQQNVTIVNQTTNVTNITYNNSMIVSEGPNYDQLRSHSREPLERLRIEREYEVRDEQTPQASVRGNVIAMMTPLFTAQVTERPRNLGAPIRETTVERNWASAGNQMEAERARAKMRAEATPPPDGPLKRYDRPALVAATAAPVATPATSPTASALASATPTPVTSLDATNAATATPRPSRSWSPSPLPQPSIAPAPATPADNPTATPISTPTEKPSATSTPRPTATPVATPVATPTATPTAVSTPTPGPEASAAPKSVEEEPRNPPPLGGTNLQQMREAARAEQKRQRDEARAKGRPGSLPAADEAATPPARSTPSPFPKPVSTPTPLPEASAAPKSVEEEPRNPPPLGGTNLQQMREAARAEQKRQRDEARAKVNPGSVPPAEEAPTAPIAVEPVRPIHTPRPAFTPRPDSPTPVIMPDERAEPAATPPSKKLPPTAAPREESDKPVSPAAEPAATPDAAASVPPDSKPNPDKPGKKPGHARRPKDDPAIPGETPAGGDEP